MCDILLHFLQRESLNLTLVANLGHGQSSLQFVVGGEETSGQSPLNVSLRKRKMMMAKNIERESDMESYMFKFFNV